MNDECRRGIRRRYMTANYDPLSNELKPNAASAVNFDWPRIIVPTDADMSVLGETRHGAVDGRSVEQLKSGVKTPDTRR